MDKQSQVVDYMEIKFEGDTSIEAELLTTSLLSMIRAYQKSISSLYQDIDIEIKISSFLPGSFAVNFESFIDFLPITLSQLPAAIETSKNFIEMIKIKRDLGGKKPTSVNNDGEKVKVVNSEGNSNYYNSNVYNVYINNPKIDSSLSSAFSMLNDSTRPAISFGTNGSSVKILNKEFDKMKIPVIDGDDLTNLQKTETIIYEELLLKSPDFLGDSKWTFLYNGKAIYATIADDSFKESVRSGNVKLSAGVRIPVKLLIEAYLDEKLDLVKHSYTVLKVTGSIIEPIYSNDYQYKLF